MCALVGDTPPPPPASRLSIRQGPFPHNGIPSASRYWRGFGGRAPSIQELDFDRQMDKVSIWLEEWDHEQRCCIIERLLRHSRFEQFQFVWTVIQPALHRDFMYTAKKEFPALGFDPISTHTTRELRKRQLKERQYKARQNNYHRIPSAHLQNYNQVKDVNAVKLPEIHSGQSNNTVTNSLASESTEHKLSLSQHSELPKHSHRKGLPKGYLSRSKTIGDFHSNRSLASISSNRSVSKGTVQAAIFDGQNRSALDLIQTAPPSIRDFHRFIEMPVRRHIQDEESPRVRENTFMSSLSNFSEYSLRERKKRKQAEKDKKSSVAGSVRSLLPLETNNLSKDARELFRWYTEDWNDNQRNEFLHKILLKLDPRQHYYISSFLSVKQYRDFITFLPEHISLLILSYLGPTDIIIAGRVCKAWHRHSSNNKLWEMKCKQTDLEIPITDPNPNWKKIYRENLYVKQNWKDGRCNIISVKGHTDKVLSVTFDRKRLATGSVDKTVKIWEIKTGKCLQTLRGHTRGVWCIEFFTKNLLISAGYDGTLKIWNTKDGTCSRTLLSHEGPVWAMVRRGNVLASASQDRTARIWDISKCLLLKTLNGHNGAVFCVDMDEKGELVITGSSDRTVRIWNAESGKHLKTFWVSQTTSIMSVSYSMGYFACSYGETICLYKADHSKLLKTFDEHEKRIETIVLKITDALKMKGTIVSAGQDGALKMWDVKKSKSIHSFPGSKKQINCVHMDETKICTASYDNKVKIFDFNI